MTLRDLEREVNWGRWRGRLSDSARQSILQACVAVRSAGSDVEEVEARIDGRQLIVDDPQTGRTFIFDDVRTASRCREITRYLKAI